MDMDGLDDKVPIKVKAEDGYTQGFEGREPSLKDPIYDLSSVKSPNHYIQTMEEIRNCIGYTLKKHVGAFVQAIEELELNLPTVPPDPTIGDAIALHWSSRS